MHVNFSHLFSALLSIWATIAELKTLVSVCVVFFFYLKKKIIKNQDIFTLKYFFSAFLDANPNLSQSGMCVTIGKDKGVCVV